MMSTLAGIQPAAWDAEALARAARAWLAHEDSRLTEALGDPGQDAAAAALVVGRLLRCGADVRGVCAIALGWASRMTHNEVDAVSESVLADLAFVRSTLLAWCAHDPCLVKLLTDAGLRAPAPGEAFARHEETWAAEVAMARDNAASRLAMVSLVALHLPDDPHPWRREREVARVLAEVDALAGALAPALGDRSGLGPPTAWMREEGLHLGEGWWLELLGSAHEWRGTLAAALALPPSGARSMGSLGPTHRISAAVFGWEGLLAADEEGAGPDDPLCDEEPLACDELPPGWELRAGAIPLPHGGALLGIRVSLLPGAEGDLREPGAVCVRDVHGELLVPLDARYHAAHKHVLWGGYPARTCVVEVASATIWVEAAPDASVEAPGTGEGQVP